MRTNQTNNSSILSFGDSSLRTFTKKRYQYTGKEKDAESGLYYYGARYYAAWTCRFTSTDPLAAEYPNLSAYAYAFNNPLGFNDPTGMEGEEGGNVPVTTKVSENVTIVNVHAANVQYNSSIIEERKSNVNNLEKKLENFSSDSSESISIKDEINSEIKEINKLEKINTKETELAIKTNDAINDFLENSKDMIHTNKGGLGSGKNMANRFGYAEGESFNFSTALQSAFENSETGKDLLIRVGIGKTNYSNGIQVLGQTEQTGSYESMDVYRITILPSVMDKDIVLANEMGDVLFNYEKPELRQYEKNKIAEKGNNQQAHDILYDNNELDSKAYSSYIEQMYRNNIGRK